jgi:hypothetical protein
MINYNDREKSILLYLFEKKHTTRESSVPVSKICEDLNLTPTEFNNCKSALLTIHPAIIHPWVDAADRVDNISIDQMEGAQWYEVDAPQFQPKESTTIDRYKLTLEILELINSNPLNGVDITSLIERNSNGLTFQEQKSLRIAIKGIIIGFENNGDIEIVDVMVRNIAASQSFVFLSNGGRLKSTWKHEKERQKELNDKQVTVPNHVININAPVKDSIIGKDNSYIKNQPDSEMKGLAKKTVIWGKWAVIITAIGVLTAIAIYLLQRK